MRYRLVIFDLDGTVLETLCDLNNSLIAALEQAGYPTHSLEKVRQMVGNGMVNLVQRSLEPVTDRDAFTRVYELFRAHYREHCFDNTHPYEGICPLLRRLRENGIQTALLTNKNHDAMAQYTERFFPGLFDFQAGYREGVPPKPAPDSVNACLDALGVCREDAVFVGDSEVDLQTAKNAQMDVISVTWGFRERSLLEAIGATEFADTVDELGQLLLGEGAR